jgi:hypothetical protein
MKLTKKRERSKEEMKMKKLIAALMLVAFFGVTAGTAIAADVAKGDTVKKCPKGKVMKDGKCVKEEPKK